MQSWKFNSQARTFLFYVIGIGLKIPYHEIYKTLRNFDHNTQIIELKNGKKYKVKLEEIW